MRREWQSCCFKAFDEKELPSLSILDFAVIPLKKPRHQRVDEKNQDEGRRTFNLFTNKNLRIGLKRASARRRRIRVTVDGI